jgi:hypothetical protein
MDNSNPSRGIGKKCKKCGKSSVEGAVFGTRKVKTRDGLGLYEKLICKACENEYSKQHRQENPDKVAEIKQRYHNKHGGTIKHHVQEKIATWRKASSVPSDLTVEYLVDLYDQQDGLCYYSKEKMIFGWVDGKVHHNSLSLDKLDPEKGYVQGNVVWCCYLVNTMKQNMNEQRFYESIDRIFKKTYGVSMPNLTIAEKLQRITINAKLGTLPTVIEQQCVPEAQRGKSSHIIHFYEGSKSLAQFIGSLGPYYQAIWTKISGPTFGNDTGMKEEDFISEVVELLKRETGLGIEFIPDNVKTHRDHYSAGAVAVLKVNW